MFVFFLICFFFFFISPIYFVKLLVPNFESKLRALQFCSDNCNKVIVYIFWGCLGKLESS